MTSNPGAERQPGEREREIRELVAGKSNHNLSFIDDWRFLLSQLDEARQQLKVANELIRSSQKHIHEEGCNDRHCYALCCDLKDYLAERVLEGR